MNARYCLLLVPFLFTAPLVTGMHAAEGAVEVKSVEPIVRGQLFISTVYPLLEVDDQRVEMVSITDGYNFWGRTLISLTNDKFYFPAPLSYPFRFTKAGIAELQSQLRKIPEVDSSSILEKNFPNIPSEQLSSYEPQELKQILLKESFIRFKLKTNKQIEIMAFPTFVVLALDYTKAPINSPKAYDDIKQTFRTAVEDFQKMEHLRTILGISRKTQRWSTVPILTFVAIDSYHDVQFKLFGKPTTPEESKRIFLNTVSLRDYSKGIENYDVTDTHCGTISHEASPMVGWRYYYSGVALLTDFTERTHPISTKGPT